MRVAAAERPFQAAFKHGWNRLVQAAGPKLRVLERHQADLVPSPSPDPHTAAAFDPVALTILAVNRLGPATFRTVSLGKAVSVTVPDARTGEIFRLALAEMQKSRRTDRLIEIVVANDPDPRATPALEREQG
jgi:hypothetical protein